MGEERPDALDLLADARFDEWRGLPPGLELQGVTARFPPSHPATAPGYLGSAGTPVRYITVPVPGFRTELRVWFRPGDAHVVLIEGTGTPPELDTLADRLGEPDARLDTYLNVLPLEGGELVFAGRGLTLFTNPATGRLLRLGLYERTTIDDYERRIRLDLELHDRAHGEGR